MAMGIDGGIKLKRTIMVMVMDWIHFNKIV